MGDRIVALIEAYNRRRPPGEPDLTAQRLSLIASDGKNPDVVRDLLRQEERIRSGARVRKTAGIDAERLLKIARFFGVTAAYLRTGQDDMDALNITGSPFAPGIGIGQPVISVTGGMGGGGMADETSVSIAGINYRADDVRGEVIIPEFMLASLSHSARRNAVHWFDVAGDSMEPTLNSGDWIAVNVKDKRISHGGIFALRDHLGTIIVKRLELETPNKVAIISDNARSQKPKVEPVGDITIIGRVIGRITRVS